jgi:hypothetical protein
MQIQQNHATFSSSGRPTNQSHVKSLSTPPGLASKSSAVCPYSSLVWYDRRGKTATIPTRWTSHVFMAVTVRLLCGTNWIFICYSEEPQPAVTTHTIRIYSCSDQQQNVSEDECIASVEWYWHRNRRIRAETCPGTTNCTLTARNRTGASDWD